jgi:hypothetical protein
MGMDLGHVPGPVGGRTTLPAILFLLHCRCRCRCRVVVVPAEAISCHMTTILPLMVSGGIRIRGSTDTKILIRTRTRTGTDHHGYGFTRIRAIA